MLGSELSFSAGWHFLGAWEFFAPSTFSSSLLYSPPRDPLAAFPAACSVLCEDETHRALRVSHAHPCQHHTKEHVWG